MKKIFTILSVALLSVSAFAELAYNATLTQNDFNNNKTVIAKIVPDGSEVVWEDGQIRCGGSDKGAFSGPAWNWDDKGVVIALAAGVPNQLSFQYATNNGTSTKGKSNWTAPDWYVDESADGSSWTNAWTTNSNSTSFSSKTVSLKTTTRYIRMYFSGNFAGYFKDIKVTEQILMGAPSPAVLDFGTVKVDDAVEAQTFTINYTGMVPTASSSDTHFTVTPESFGSLYDYKKNQTITVGLKTNEAGEYNGTITVSGRSKSAQVTVSGKVEKYDQSIIWEPAETYNYGEAIPVAVATSGLDVDYEISDASVLKFENGAFVALHGGEATVTAKQAGNYKYNAAADVVKTITIVPPTTYGDFEQTTCDEAVEFNNQTYDESFADDVNVGENYLGGDSIVHVNIVINHPTFGTDEKTIVYGTDESWNGISLKDSTVGVHTVVATIENVAGCDSTVTLTLTVNKMETLNVPVDLQFCAGGSDFFRGVEYSEAGTYPVNVTGATRDTVYNVTVTVLQPTTGTDTKTIVYGADESWNGISLKDSTVGVHYVVYETTNVAGCDSTVTLTLTVNKMDTLEVYYPIGFCTGDSAEYRGKWYYEFGEDTIYAEGDVRDTIIYVEAVLLPTTDLLVLYDTIVSGNEVILPEGEWVIGEDTVSGTYPTVESEDASELIFNQYFDEPVVCGPNYIELIVTVTPKEQKPGDTTTDIEDVLDAQKAEKVLIGGTLYIRRGERLFTAEGREVK